MIITCAACSTRFVLDDALIKPEGSKVRCSKCRHVFTAFPEKTPEAPPAVEIPGPPGYDEQEISFEEPKIQNDLDFNVLQDDDFSIDRDSDNPPPDLEEADIDFSEIKFDDPEFKQDPAQDSDEDGLELETADFEKDGPKLDFQGDDLELDIQNFGFENGISSGPASVPANSDPADIEISFARNEGAGADLEQEKRLFDMDDPALEESSIIEDEGLPPNDVKPESDDNEEPNGREADEKIEQTVSEQDKFAEYDKVLEQETEPEDADITILDPEIEENTSLPETPLPPTDDGIKTTTEVSIEKKPLITPPSAQSVRQKRGTKKKKGVSLPVIILLVLFLLMLAAYVAIIRLGVTIPVVSDIQIPFVTEWLQPKQAPRPPLKPTPDEPSIDGRFVSNKSAGDLFIVTGRIKNPSNTAVSYIQIKGTLMTKDNTKAETLTAYCGNIIPEETLKSGNISDITKQMGVRQGNQDTNVNIKPGTSVMFMLVFSNLPEDLANFTVAVQGFEPAKK